MKKQLLTGMALLVFAATSHAQIYQNGEQQFAQQNQNGTNQTGVISQLGTPTTNYGNYAITFQGTAVNTGANVANINQNSGPTTSAMGVMPPTIGPGQGSQGNRAGITQNGGPGNVATINQNGGPDGISGGGLERSATIGAAGGDGNFAGILQQGTGNTATINENNNSRQNFGEVYQNGDGLMGTINQSSSSINNRATINQGFQNNIAGAAISGSTATINQSQLDRNAFVTPIAESIGNTATITQSVSNVKAVINQGSTFSGTSYNFGRTEGSTASITQSAANEFTARIDQGVTFGESLGSQATIMISGENNTNSLIIQGGNSNGSDNGSVAAITMAGRTSSAFSNAGVLGQTYGNQATINQSITAQMSDATLIQGQGTGSSSYNDQATILQTGSSNFALIFQNSRGRGSGAGTGSDNVANISQLNGVNQVSAMIRQGLSFNGEITRVVRNLANINQTGGTNLSANISQGSVSFGFGSLTTLSGPDAVLDVIAYDNSAIINQSGGENQTASILQSGRNNVGIVNQSAGSSNNAQIIQTANSRFAQAVINQSSSGSNNLARSFQFNGANADGRGGFGNQIEINQIGTGSNNLAIAQQGFQGATNSSNDNFIRLTQNGNDNVARMYQQGNNNFVDLTQNGNGNRLEGEGGLGTTASQIGYGNRLTLVQNADSKGGQVFQYSQVGNNNVQIVTQTSAP